MIESIFHQVKNWHGGGNYAPLIGNNKTIYNTAEDFFEKIGPREKWPSSWFDKLGYSHPRQNERRYG